MFTGRSGTFLRTVVNSSPFIYFVLVSLYNELWVMVPILVFLSYCRFQSLLRLFAFGSM